MPRPCCATPRPPLRCAAATGALSAERSGGLLLLLWPPRAGRLNPSAQPGCHVRVRKDRRRLTPTPARVQFDVAAPCAPRAGDPSAYRAGAVLAGRMIRAGAVARRTLKPAAARALATETKVGFMQAMEGNMAASHVAYALSETAFIYPISPATSMGEHVDTWASAGRKNVFGQVLDVSTMQSEAGAAGAVHGALAAGGLSTTFTASQGLLLMIPNMYLIAGELMPVVFHVSARAVAKHALTIFNDHSDVMACRQTGFAMLCSNSVQEIMDLALVAHLSSLEARLPFMHFFDGYRTSAQVNKINVIPYDDMKPLVPEWALTKNLRDVALNPVKPIIRGTGQRPDIFMQGSVAAHGFYLDAPEIVQAQMDKVGELTGRKYSLFDYHGDPEAERVVVMMGSGSRTVEEVVDHLNGSGEKTGVLKVRLFRPWSAEHMIAAMPDSAKRITVLDRTREDGAMGMPLYLDVSASFSSNDIPKTIVGGQYGLASKEFTPAMAKAIFDNLGAEKPRNNFVVGVNDDVTHTSLAYGEEFNCLPKGTKQCLFWGFGTDGTVGSNKQAIKMIGDNTDLYTQGHFAYDSHKGGGVTMSHLRFGPEPIKAEYEILNDADYIACHNTSYVHKFDMIKSIKQGGTFLLNTNWTNDELAARVPNKLKEQIANMDLNFYTIDATTIASSAGLGQRVNTVMQAGFYHLSEVLPPDEAIALLKQNIEQMYARKGPRLVAANIKAVDNTVSGIVKIEVPDSWKTATTSDEYAEARDYVVKYQPKDWETVTDRFNENNKFVEEIMHPVTALEGDSLPVSAFLPGGYMPVGTTQYEKRGIAAEVPVWKEENCTQCNYCNIVCPHAVIRPFLFTKDELKSAPKGFQSLKAQGGAEVAGLNYSIQLATLDCTGCEVCVKSCPDDALYMAPFGEAAEPQVEGWEFSMSQPNKGHMVDKFTVKGSQFQEPLLEFHGACSGCGETPYVKLLTQLYGDRLMIANASGCSSVWGGTSTTNPYRSLSKSNEHAGRGPAWGRSLFEDNAEYGLGMHLATLQRRKQLQNNVEEFMADEQTDVIAPELLAALQGWQENFSNYDKQSGYADTVMELIDADASKHESLNIIANNKQMLAPVSQWIIGGDGWAYDIGFGGLDHVMARGENVNFMILDTEMYSNTGGQVSKATPQAGAVKFATAGKKVAKKDLGKMMIGYGDIYVASIAMGADYGQSLKAIQEAEEYPGTSMVICYSPCIDWGIDMKNMMQHQKQAVDSGYWPLYRYDPRAATEDGSSAMQLDSRRIKTTLESYMEKENRFASLMRTGTERSQELAAGLENDVKTRMAALQRDTMDELELLDSLKAKYGEETGERALILYASETGNTADLAKLVQYEMKRRDIRANAIAFDDIDVNDLVNEKLVINLVATCGQGEWPANSRGFWKDVNEDLGSDFLENVKFATFSMGDSGYVFFNECGRLMDERFTELGATAIVPNGNGDDQDEDKWETAFEDWIPELWNELGAPPPPKSLLPASHTVSVISAADAAKSPDHEFITPKDAGGAGEMVPLTHTHLLTPGGRDVRHMEWYIGDSEITYEAGDALGIFSTNHEDRVAEFLDWYGIKADDVLEVEDTTGERSNPLPNLLTASELFTQRLDIFGRPKRQFYELLEILAEDEGERAELERLGTKDGKDDLRELINETHTYASLMQKFSSAKVPLEYVLDFIPEIKPRLYSIASAPEMHPDHIHLCIVEEDWENSQGVRHGQSTWFVRNLAKGQKWGTIKGLRDEPEPIFNDLSPDDAPKVPVRVNAGVVHLPDDPKTPLVMVGLGTGLAPFRSFIQQRFIQRQEGIEVGDMLLYFGARYEETEFLYGDEIEEYHKDGILTDLKKAFSRDQEHKIYAQHRIEEDPELMYDYMINKKGSFYLCGPAGNMPVQMEAAVNAAFVKCGNMTEEEATTKINELKIAGFYNVEVW